MPFNGFTPMSLGQNCTPASARKIASPNLWSSRQMPCRFISASESQWPGNPSNAARTLFSAYGFSHQKRAIVESIALA